MVLTPSGRNPSKGSNDPCPWWALALGFRGKPTETFCLYCQDSWGGWALAKVVGEDEQGGNLRVHYRGWSAAFDETLDIRDRRIYPALRPVPVANAPDEDDADADRVEPTTVRLCLHGAMDAMLPSQDAVAEVGDADGREEWGGPEAAPAAGDVAPAQDLDTSVAAEVNPLATSRIAEVVNVDVTPESTLEADGVAEAEVVADERKAPQPVGGDAMEVVAMDDDAEQVAEEDVEVVAGAPAPQEPPPAAMGHGAFVQSEAQGSLPTMAGPSRLQRLADDPRAKTATSRFFMTHVVGGEGPNVSGARLGEGRVPRTPAATTQGKIVMPMTAAYFQRIFLPGYAFPP